MALKVQERRIIGNRYRIGREIGRGPTGTVYLAHDESRNREVALRLLRSQLAADTATAARWLATASLAQGLRHPNVLAVYDSGADAGTYYVVQEYAPGGSMRDLLKRRGTLLPAEVLPLAEQIVAGLARPRQRELVHGDLKPENVLFGSDGTAKIGDFGLALSVLPADGLPLNTLYYASPEVTQGETPSEASDIYSLGALLYQTLVGRPPFAAGHPREVAHLQRERKPIRPRAVDPRLPPQLEIVVLQALANLPADRWSGLASVAGALQTYREAMPAAQVAERVTGSPRRTAPPVPSLLDAPPETRLSPRWPLAFVSVLAFGLMVWLVLAASVYVPKAVSASLQLLPTSAPTRDQPIVVRVIQPTGTPTVTPSKTPTPLPGTTYTPTPSPTRTPTPQATATPTP